MPFTKKVQEIPERMTTADSPMLPLCPAPYFVVYTHDTCKCQPASHPRTRPTLLSPQGPHIPCFPMYLLLYIYNMFQAGNHEFRSQRTESEPRTAGLQGGDDL